MATCLHCGGEYRVRPSRAGTSKYCSRLCQNRGAPRRRLGKCVQCGAEFIRGSMKRETCSLLCLVMKNLVPEPNSGCWLWDKALSRDGYGSTGYEPSRPHIVTYEAKYGPVPDGFELDHICKTKPCANPDHLEAVTHAENMRRHFGGRTTCKNGHKLTPETVRIETYPSRRGARMCLVCKEARA